MITRNQTVRNEIVRNLPIWAILAGGQVPCETDSFASNEYSQPLPGVDACLAITYILVGMINATRKVGWPHHNSRIVPQSAPKGEINEPKDIQDNRISKLRACCRAGCELANARTIQNPVCEHGRA